MKFLLPIVLLIIGSGAGVGAGIFMKPTAKEVTALPEEKQSDSEIPDNQADKPEPSTKKEDADLEYVELSNQFVVPIVHKDRISSMIVAALSVEVAQGYSQTILDKEPKLRSEFLKVFFDHANMGGFSGAFTELNNLRVLQNALVEVAQKTIGEDIVSDVLIFEIARQDY